MPRRVSPLVYERFTEGGRYVAAMVESPDGYSELFKYRPSDDARRILATYPRSGVYRVDDLSAPVLTFEGEIEEADIVGFFEQGDSVQLITRGWATLRFYRGTTLVREVSGDQQLEWIHAPWFYVDNCGAGPAVDFRLDETGARRQVVVETPEDAEFRYDARTGRLVSVSRESFVESEWATPAEEDLATIVSQVLEEATVEPGEFGDFDLYPRIAEVAVEGCMFVERAGNWRNHYGGGAKDRRPPGFASLGIDAHGGARLRHSQEAVFDLYRVPAGQGSQFLCGGDILEDGWLATGVREELGPDQWEPVLERATTAFRGPTVAALTTWDVSTDEAWEGVGRLGIATLWSRATGEWRVIMVHAFVVPEVPRD